MNTIRVRLAMRAEQRVDVGASIALGRGHRHGADPERAQLVHQEAVRAVEHLVARTGVGAHQELDQLVGAGAADDPVGIELEAAADRPRAAPASPSG